MSVAIRAATVEDGPGIAQVRILTWQKAYRGLIPDEILSSLDIEEDAQRWREGLSQLPTERAVYVAELLSPQKQVVGFCACGLARDASDENWGEIYALYVLPEVQGQGIGRGLVQTASRWLAGRGYRHLIIFVLQNNMPSRRFYESIGGVIEQEKMVDIKGFQASEVGYGYELSEAGLRDW